MQIYANTKLVLMPLLPTLCVCENVELQKTRIGTTVFQINILGNNNTFNTKQNMEHDRNFVFVFHSAFFFAQFLSVVTFAFKHCKFLHQMQKYSKNNIHHGKSDLSWKLSLQTFLYNSVLLTGVEFNYTVRDFLCPWHWLVIDFSVIRNSGFSSWTLFLSDLAILCKLGL